MSNIYIKEPATNGKVILKTTLGDFDCELWSREAPKASRNFIQLCMEGYYDDTIFHRVLKGFIAQGGDPTGTGFGGESIYGEPFKDEFHSRLRFVRRGLLAMANSEKDSNGSQFFFTLGACPELQEKHTIFGKVVGNTVYNMMKFDDLQVDQNDRPLYPPKIQSAEIVFNPFDDILPRKRDTKKATKKQEKPKVKGTKDFKLLSFGDEAEEEEEAVDKVIKEFKGKSKSSHDLLDDPKLSSIPAVDPSLAAINQKRLKGDIKDKDEDDVAENANEDEDEEITRKRRKLDVASKIRSKFISKSNPFGEGTSKDFVDDPFTEEDPMNDKRLRLEELKSESKQLKKSLAKKKPESEIKPNKSENKSNPLIVDLLDEINKMKTDLKSQKAKKSRINEKFEKFKLKYELSQLPDDHKKDDVGESTATIKPSLLALFNHKMISEESEPVLAKDANLINEADWFDIHDPRHPVNKRRREPGNQSTTTTKKSSNHDRNNRH